MKYPLLVRLKFGTHIFRLYGLTCDNRQLDALVYLRDHQAKIFSM